MSCISNHYRSGGKGRAMSRIMWTFIASSLSLIFFAAFASASMLMNGVGSTFIDPVFRQWANAYEKLTPDARFTIIGRLVTRCRSLAKPRHRLCRQ